MKKVALTLVSDFEIVEAMAPLDMLRRAGIYAVSYTHLTLPTNREV